MKSIFSHPSSLLDETVVNTIRQNAGQAETLCQLHPAQLKLVHEQKWLKFFVPKEYGGMEMSLPEILKLEESLAWADGSTAWVVTLCAGAAWFVGFLDSEFAAEIFANDNVFIAGSGMTTGTAEKTEDGFVVNGFWKYASGAQHATHFTANCVITKNGKPVLEKGKPRIRAFVFSKNEVTIHNTWNSMGMVATASHSFEVKNLTVPTPRQFLIDSTRAVIDKPIFHFPFLQLTETTLTVNLSGMALRFIELAEELLKAKSSGTKAIAHSKKKIEDQRKAFYKIVESSWRICESRKVISKSMLAQLSKESHALAVCSRQVVNDLFPYCGLRAADTSTEINRVWRNVHTASQHNLFASKQWQL